MARVVVYVPDLLFGSNVTAAVQAAGHDPVLAADAERVRQELAGAALLIIDLTSDPEQRIDSAKALTGVPKLGFYSHVETGVRAQAEEAGFDLVVPRSRMAREGADLVSRLVAS